jgi:hypothetical protein
MMSAILETVSATVMGKKWVQRNKPRIFVILSTLRYEDIAHHKLNSSNIFGTSVFEMDF